MGSGFDAIAKQRQQNNCELRGGKNCNPQGQSTQIPFINGRKKNKVDLPEGILDFNADGKTEDELFRIYGFDGAGYQVKIGDFSESEIEESGIDFTRSNVAVAVAGGLYKGLERGFSNSKFWIDAKGNIKSTKLLEQGVNGKHVQGVNGLRNGRVSAARVASKFKVAGKAVGVVGIGLTIYQFGTSQKSGADYARLAGSFIITGSGFIPVVGPFITVGLGIADGLGAFDSIYNSFN